MPCHAPSHHPAGLLMVVGLIAVLAGAASAVTASAGCSTAQLAAEGPQAVAMMSEACPALVAIPVAGPYAAEACQGVEGVVAAAVTQAELEVRALADAGALDTTPGKRALYRTVGGRRVLVGYCSCALQAAAQRHLDAMGDGGSPPAAQIQPPNLQSSARAASGLLTASAALPVANAGKDGGS